MHFFSAVFQKTLCFIDTRQTLSDLKDSIKLHIITIPILRSAVGNRIFKMEYQAKNIEKFIDHLLSCFCLFFAL